MKNMSKLWLAIGAGFAIGGLIGLLFAPEKGTVTRKKIAGKGKDFARDLKDKFMEGREKEMEVKEEFEPKLFIQAEQAGDMV